MAPLIVKPITALITGKKGTALIKEREGLHDGNPKTPELEPKICPAGYPTLGWGSRFGLDGKPVTLKHRAITLAEADALLARDLGAVEHLLRGLVSRPLNQNQFDALVSFVYNLGSGNFSASTLRRTINQYGTPSVTEKMFTDWNKARVNGVLVPLNGLTIRRKKEYNLFIDPYFDPHN